MATQRRARDEAALLAEDIGGAIRSKLLPWKEVMGREEIETIIRNIIKDKGDARRGRVNLALKLSAEKA
jgi:coniferyl-alcohol glucosyltransferase